MERPKIVIKRQEIDQSYSDIVVSESESEGSVKEKKKRVKKSGNSHHKNKSQSEILHKRQYSEHVYIHAVSWTVTDLPAPVVLPPPLLLSASILEKDLTPSAKSSGRKSYNQRANIEVASTHISIRATGCKG